MPQVVTKSDVVKMAAQGKIVRATAAPAKPDAAPQAHAREDVSDRQQIAAAIDAAVTQLADASSAQAAMLASAMERIAAQSRPANPAPMVFEMEVVQRDDRGRIAKVKFTQVKGTGR